MVFYCLQLCYNWRMKRVLIFMLIVFLLLCLGCQNRLETGSTFDVLEPSASASGAAAQSGGRATTRTTASGTASVEVTATVAYVFEGKEGFTLYGAAEYQNTGSVPVTLSSADFRFTVDGTAVHHTFTPMLSEYDVVMPGETSYAVLWLPVQNESTKPTLQSSVTLAAELTCARTDSIRGALDVDDLFLVQNYPGFATLTGCVRNPAANEYSLNMIYAGFYDADGQLLGVWYLTKNALFEQGDEKRFVTHLKELPIAGLAENTAQFKTTAFAFM